MDKSQWGVVRFMVVAMTASLGVTQVEAAQPGLYFGVQGGWAEVHDTGITRGDMNELITDALGNGNFTLTSFSGKETHPGAAWRILGGYQIGFNWAAEIGWAVYPDLSVRPTASGVDNNTGQAYTVGTTGTYKTAVFDFDGKYIYPFGCCSNMNIYGKLGLALVTGWATPTITLTEPTLSASANKNNDKSTSLYPTFGIGFGYDFRPDITGDVSYNRIQQVGGSGSQGSIDFASVGLIFHFG